MSSPFDIFESCDDPLGFIAGEVGLDVFLDETRLRSVLERADIFGQDGGPYILTQSNYPDEDLPSEDDGSVVDLDLPTSLGHLPEDRFVNEDIDETVDWILRSPTPAPFKPVQVSISQDVGLTGVQDIAAHGTNPLTAENRVPSGYNDTELPAVRTEEPLIELQSAELADNIPSDNPKGPKRLRLDEKSAVSAVSPPSTPRRRGRPRSSTIHSTPATPPTFRRRSATFLSVPALPSTPRRSPRNHLPPTSQVSQRSREVKMEVDADGDEGLVNVSAIESMMKGVKLEQMDVDDELLLLPMVASKVDDSLQTVSVPAESSTPRRSPRNHPPPTPRTLQKCRNTAVKMDMNVDCNDGRISASVHKGTVKARRKSKRLAAKVAKRKKHGRFLRRRVRSGPKVKSIIIGRFISGGRWKCCIRGCGFVTADSRKRGAHKGAHVRARARA